MRVLALNCGSSSVKSALIDAGTGRRLHEMRVENIGSDHARLYAGDVTTDLDLVSEPSGFGSRQTYQSAFGLSLDERDSTNHGCWSLVWFGT